jgi:hypothetical protein
VRLCPPAVRRTCHATPTPVRSRYTLVVIHPFSSPVYRQSTAISCSSTDRQLPLVHNCTSGVYPPCTARSMPWSTSIVPIVPRVQYSIRSAHHRSWWQVQLRDHHHRSLTAGSTAPPSRTDRAMFRRYDRSGSPSPAGRAAARARVFLGRSAKVWSRRVWGRITVIAGQVGAGSSCSVSFSFASRASLPRR